MILLTVNNILKPIICLPHFLIYTGNDYVFPLIRSCLIQQLSCLITIVLHAIVSSTLLSHNENILQSFIYWNIVCSSPYNIPVSWQSAHMILFYHLKVLDQDCNLHTIWNHGSKIKKNIGAQPIPKTNTSWFFFTVFYTRITPKIKIFLVYDFRILR